MTISLPPFASKASLRLIQFAFLIAICGSLNTLRAANPANAPVLISESTSTRAIAFESVTMKPEPFQPTASVSFSTDTRTRIAIFATGLDLLAGEGTSSFTADAEDSTRTRYPLTIEAVGPVPGFPGISMIILRLNDSMGDLGDVLLRLNLHGNSSNRVRTAIGHLGGGPDFQHLRTIGMQAYIDEQFNMPPLFGSVSSNYPATALYPQFYPGLPTPPCDAICSRDNYSLYPLQKQFMTNALTQNDQLRQRVAFALHKLIVVGGVQLNSNETSWFAPYLQTIDRNAFGNFRNLLFEVSLNPGMGEYLNMRGNSVVNRANPTPNENYAREIMQLFSIGVDVLNQDGTPVLDAQGNRLPSYDQTTISNLARVFTGWDLDVQKPWVLDNTINVTNYLDPMVPNGNINRYDIAQKTLLTDINNSSAVVIPACTNCTGGIAATNLANTKAYAIASLNTAINNLFNHSNTGPYICGQLIHQLVTSNPSPNYVGRCSAAFADNGSGVRGDMKAVITAILLDPEARGDVKNDPTYGHLREPVLLMTHLLRTFNATGDGVLVTNSPNSYSNDMGQNVFNPPTVFSYFPADFALAGTNLFGPEYGLLDTSLTYKRANFMNTLFLANGGNGIPVNGTNRPTGTQLNLSAYTALAGTPQQLVDLLNTRLMHGTMSPAVSANIVQTITAITNATPATQDMQRTQTAIYLVATSAQYQVER